MDWIPLIEFWSVVADVLVAAREPGKREALGLCAGVTSLEPLLRDRALAARFTEKGELDDFGDDKDPIDFLLS